MATISAISNGDWHSTSTWSTSGIPTSSDTVYLGGYTVTIGTNTLAACQDLVLHANGATATAGTLHITSSDAFLDISADLVVGVACTTTEGSIFILGTCVTCEITVGGTLRSVSTTDMTYGFIQRRGNFSTACDITINGNYVSPTSGINSWMLLGAYNTNGSVYDTWTWNGSITFDGHQNGGSYRGLINGDTSSATNLIINGDVYFNYTADGVIGGMLLGTIDPPNPMSIIINGNLTNGGNVSIASACYTLCSSTNTVDTYSLGRTISVEGDVIALDAYPAIIGRGGNLTVTGSVTTINGLGTAIQLEGDVSGNIGRVVAPASSEGVIQYGTTYVGDVSISEVDCRDQLVNTTDTLVSLAASSVPVDIYLDVIYPGACIGVKPMVNASTTLVVDSLHTADTSTAATLAPQPGIDTAAYPSVKTVLSSLIVGNLGAWPISGLWQLADASSTIQARDQNNQPITLVQGGDIPTIADVRQGVAVGSEVGTLIVPQAANVAVGVVYDNGTVGTLNSSSGLTTLQSDISAIRLVTDQLELVEQQEAGTDRYYNDVVSLINLSAATPGAASFTDTQGHTFTRNGSNANIVASPISLGNQSLSLRGSYFSYSDASLVLGVSDFTIELFVILDGTPNNYGAVIAGGSYNNGQWSIRRAGPTQLLFTTGTGANVLFGILDDVSWYHLAVVRESGVVKTYLNGVLGDTGTDTVNYSSSTVYLGTDTAIIGHSTIANVRISKTVRYTTGFTVPTVEFPVTYKEPIHVITAYIDPMIGENVGQLVVDVADIREVTDKIGFDSTVPVTHDRDYSSVVTLINLKEAVPNTATFMDVQGHTFTRNGSNASVDTTETYLGNPVITLTGNIFNSTSADFALGTSDFTIEFWFKPNTDRTLYGSILSTGPYSSGHWSIRRNGTSSDFMYTTGTGAGAIIGTIADNTWTHVAVVRESGVVTTYLNGGLGSTVADTRNYTGTTLYVGTDTNFVCQGTVSNVRISRIVRYTTGFTPPTVEYPVINAVGYYEVIASGGTTVDSSAQLTTIQTALSSVDASVIDIKAQTDLLAFTAAGVVADGGANATDYTARFDTLDTTTAAIKAKTDLLSFIGYETVITGDVHISDVAALLHFDDNFTTHNNLVGNVTGDVTLDTTEKKFGTASAKFNGGFIEYTTTTSTAFGTGDFTVEAWVRHTTFSTTRPHLISNVPQATLRAGTWSLVVLQNQIQFVEVVDSTYPGAYFTLPTPLTVDTWRHIAVTRSNGTVMLFIDGALIGSQPLAVDFNEGSYPLTLGTGASYNAHYGHMDEVRVTKGVARYMTTFTAPLLPFSTVAGTAIVEVEGVIGNAILECKDIEKVDYTARFDTLDTSVAGITTGGTVDLSSLATPISEIKAKTDLLSFGANGVNATASVDTSTIATTTANLINPGVTGLVQQLTTHNTDISQQLTTIQTDLNSVNDQSTDVLTTITKVKNLVIAGQ